MTTPVLSVTRARELLAKITLADDGAHAAELLELVHGIAEPDNLIATEVKKDLYFLTSECQSHFAAYLEKLKAA